MTDIMNTSSIPGDLSLNHSWSLCVLGKTDDVLYANLLFSVVWDNWTYSVIQKGVDCGIDYVKRVGTQYVSATDSGALNRLDEIFLETFRT